MVANEKNSRYAIGLDLQLRTVDTDDDVKKPLRNSFHLFLSVQLQKSFTRCSVSPSENQGHKPGALNQSAKKDQKCSSALSSVFNPQHNICYIL